MSAIRIQSSNLPANFCHESWPSTWGTLVGLLSADFSGNVNTFTLSATEPTPENRDKPWMRLNSDGSPDKWYVYWNGFWVSPHPVKPGPLGIVTMYEGAEASITTFDGGESATLGPASGPMWEKVSQLDAKSPLGPGTLASGTVVGLGDSGGEEKHTMTAAELVSHTHQFASGDMPKSFSTSIGAETREGSVNQTGSLDYKPLTVLQNTGSTTPFNVMHPYYGIFFIRRTSRIFYRL